MSEIGVRDVECSACGARPGQDCEGDGMGYHLSRFDRQAEAADEAKARRIHAAPPDHPAEDACPLGKASCDPLVNGCDGECETVPAEDAREAQGGDGLVVDVSIKAQNPDLETAWRTIAWWEQTCGYWHAEAQRGYALRDSLPTRDAAIRDEAAAAAEQRGREDNADHAMCYVHGSRALEAKLREAADQREREVVALVREATKPRKAPDVENHGFVSDFAAGWHMALGSVRRALGGTADGREGGAGDE